MKKAEAPAGVIYKITQFPLNSGRVTLVLIILEASIREQ